MTPRQLVNSQSQIGHVPFAHSGGAVHDTGSHSREHLLHGSCGLHSWCCSISRIPTTSELKSEVQNVYNHYDVTITLACIHATTANGEMQSFRHSKHSTPSPFHQDHCFRLEIFGMRRMARVTLIYQMHYFITSRVPITVLRYVRIEEDYLPFC